MEKPAVKKEPPDDNASSLDAASTVKTEPADDVYSQEKETIVKVEIDIEPLVIQPSDIQYMLKPCKAEPVQDAVAGTSNSDATNNIGRNAINASVDTSAHEQPYSCIICNKIFVLTSDLDTHVRSCVGAMGRSRAEYMRDYRQKKRKEKLKTGMIEPKKLARNSTQRSRDFRAGAANSILSQASTADSTTGLPNLLIGHATLPFSPAPSTSTACNTDPAEIQLRPADNEQERLVRVDVEQVEDVDLTVQKCFQCHICKKKYRLKSKFKQHLLVHTREKQYHCSVCKKSFKDKSNLNKHFLIHTGEKPHHCSVCKKRFNDKSNLKTHLIIHTGEKPYHCSICKKSFNQKNHLNAHILVHTAEKLHHCSVCKKSFTHKAHLNAHILLHTGEKPHQCNVCERSFTQKCTLKDHLLVHTGEKPHHCKICEKSFTQLSTLKSHVLLHTGEKPHRCNVCEKSFTQKSTLKDHLLIHTGEKPHHCNVCKKSFTKKSTLKSHFLVHTGERYHQSNAKNKSKYSECAATLVNTEENP